MVCDVGSRFQKLWMSVRAIVVALSRRRAGTLAYSGAATTLKKNCGLSELIVGYIDSKYKTSI